MNSQQKLRMLIGFSILLLSLLVLSSSSPSLAEQPQSQSSKTYITSDLGIKIVKHDHWPQYGDAFMHDLLLRTDSLGVSDPAILSSIKVSDQEGKSKNE